MNLPTNQMINLSSIEPLAVYSYLEDNGWTEERKIDNRAAILTLTNKSKKYSAFIAVR